MIISETLPRTGRPIRISLRARMLTLYHNLQSHSENPRNLIPTGRPPLRLQEQVRRWRTLPVTSCPI